MGARTRAEHHGSDALALLQFTEAIHPRSHRRHRALDGNRRARALQDNKAFCLCDWATEEDACLRSANDGSLSGGLAARKNGFLLWIHCMQRLPPLWKRPLRMTGQLNHHRPQSHQVMKKAVSHPIVQKSWR